MIWQNLYLLILNVYNILMIVHFIYILKQLILKQTFRYLMTFWIGYRCGEFSQIWQQIVKKIRQC